MRPHGNRAFLREQIAGQGIPWYRCVALAVTSVTIGAHWDVPAPVHWARYVLDTGAHGDVLVWRSGGDLVWVSDFQYDVSVAGGTRGSVVGVFGFRAPLGAFLGASVGVAMLTSAPFENWWHDAYGWM